MCDGGESLDVVLDKWNQAKVEEAAIKKRIEDCKSKVEGLLTKQGVNDILTSKYKVNKRMQSRETVSKKDVPLNVWTQYAKTSEFSVISFTSLAGKKQPSAKAKAKPKAAGSQNQGKI